MATNVNSVVAELDRFTNRLVAKIALDATSNLIEATPIDTGWARANWIPYIGRRGRPPGSQGRDAQGRFTSQSNSSGDVGAARAEQAAGQAQLTSGYSVELGKIFISNGVPYITRLNDGHSTQAPSGFVERAVDKALRVDILGIGT